MLVRFALESAAIAVTQDANASVLAQHHAFLQKWSALGVMVRPIQDDDSLPQAVASMPQRFRKRWQTMLKHARKVHGPDCWTGLHNINNEADLQSLHDHVDLLLLDEATAFLSLDIPDNEPGRMLSALSMEACKFNCVELSTMFEKAEELASSGIRKGERIIDVWNQRFRSLARYCQRVTLLDRYGLNDGAEWRGFVRFAKELDGSGKNVSLRIYASISDDPQAEDAVSNAVVALRRELSRGGIQNMTVWLIPTEEFEMVHDRYVCFDSTVCELGVGISVLAGLTVYRDCSFTVKVRQQEHLDRESLLEKVCTKGSPYEC